MEENITADVTVPVWGGIECTVNRLGDTYNNQLARNGHMHRLDDLKLIANLGIKTLRYPVIWETIAPDNLENLNWSWSDSRLAKLRELRITPIVSLLHHGSGRPYTSLLDPEFPNKLAIFAKAVASITHG
jgi:dTDP-4-dehydrorhamnose reductase